MERERPRPAVRRASARGLRPLALVFGILIAMRPALPHASMPARVCGPPDVIIENRSDAAWRYVRGYSLGAPEPGSEWILRPENQWTGHPSSIMAWLAWDLWYAWKRQAARLLGVPEARLVGDTYWAPWEVAQDTGRILRGAQVMFFDIDGSENYDTWPPAPISILLISEKTGEIREMVADLIHTGHRQCEARFFIGAER
ncbi:MAG: hypothetical protein KIT20_07320 [Alphaproteobacteria bacterium]|nr:hypothetical protein [Alphaproteobacteria bacterium]